MNSNNELENVLIGNWQMRLPSAICTDPFIFNSIFSLETWDNVLGLEQKQRILQMLPKEILSSPGLVTQTIHDLFSGQLTRFDSSPLESFFNQLDGGLFDPSVVATKEAIKKVWRKDSKRLIRKCQTKLLERLLVSRQKFLEEHLPSKTSRTNGIDIESDSTSPTSNDTGNEKSTILSAQQASAPVTEQETFFLRIRKRFHDELSAINVQADCAGSDDEDFPVKKKPTCFTARAKLRKDLTVKPGQQAGKPNAKQTFESQLGSFAIVNSTVRPPAQTPSSKTYVLTPSTVPSLPAKAASRPITLKSREEQTAVQMAKFPKILPAPSTSSVTTTPAISSPVVSSSSCNSPLLASQLQAPVISTNRQQNRQLELLSTSKALSTQSSSGSGVPLTLTTSFNMNFERSTEDEMESSSEDEFESIEPTIGFASSLNSSSSSTIYTPLKTQTSKFPAKPARSAGNLAGQGQVRSLQGNSKFKVKSNIKTTNTKQILKTTTPMKLTTSTAPNALLTNTLPSTAPVLMAAISSPSPSSGSSSSSIITSYAKPLSITNAVQSQPAKSICNTSSGPLNNVRFPASTIFLTSTVSNSNPTNVISTMSSSSQLLFQAGVIPTIKLTPKLVANPILTNKLFSTSLAGISQPPETSSSNTGTVIPFRNIQSQSFNNSITFTSANTDVLKLNGPLNTKEVGITSSAKTQSDGAKNTTSGLVRVLGGGTTTSSSFVECLSSSAPSNTKSASVSTRISSSLGATLVSPISLQDLNFTLNLDGNVVRSDASEPKLLPDIIEDKIDDLSVLDGNPFDSIPNLSDELDGFDLDLVEVCDFDSLVSDEKHYASFFSLIRDVLCSTRDHRMTFICLEKTIRKWSVSPSAPSNNWYSSVRDWNDALITALNFLAGNYQDAHPEDFVPYIEYKYKTKYYQWIGAGRDSDNNLLPLCKMWLENLGKLPPIKKLEGENEEHDEEDDENEDSDGPDLEIKKKTKRPQTPPPPRFVTSWTVRPSSQDEKDYFQEQEKQRFENPHKAFTYRMHEYESVVGPVKGVYSSQSGMTNKARGHSLLVDDRPPYVTILALVRDAVARLPNGEGTRSEICEMLRDSAFLAAEASNITLNSVVSGALDRLHYERDPCVRYDSHKKSWIYLHRDRNQEQFERLHHNRSYTKSTKSRSNTSRKSRKHNKSTSSSGSQSHGPVNSTPCTSPSTSLSSISATAPIVKLPPIDTVLNKAASISSNQSGGNTTTTSSQQKEKQFDTSLISTSKPVIKFEAPTRVEASRGWQSGFSATRTVGKVGMTTSHDTIPVATSISHIRNLDKSVLIAAPSVLNSAIKSIPSSTTNLNLTTPSATTSSQNLQMSSANLSAGQFVIGPNNVVRFGSALRFGEGLRFASVRVPASAASTFGGGGLGLSPRIVLRGNMPVQNQGIIVGKTVSGQTVILSASPTGAMQLQLPPSATTQFPVSIQSQPGSSGQTINFTPTSNQSFSPGSISTVPGIGLIQSGNKLAPTESNILRGTLHLNAAVASKLLSTSAVASNLLSTSVSHSQSPQQTALIRQGITSMAQLPKQSTTSIVTPNSATAPTSVSQPTPILIRSTQGNFVVPGRISYGTGGEFKMIPISGAGNQTVFARIVPQTLDTKQLSSTAAVRFNSTPQNRTSSGQPP